MSKNVVIGVCGGIAAYKTCTLVSLLKKAGFSVDVIMTQHAAEFVTPLTFETLSKRPVVTDMFHRNAHWEVEHVALAKKADLFLVCPATANVIGKFANGIADDMLSTTLLAARCPIVFCPAMNTAMYENAVVAENIAKLKSRGVIFIEAGEGMLACGDVGKGRLAEPEEIYGKILPMLTGPRDFEGKKVLVTAGATLEKLDAVRFISNFSSGKMGFAIAEAAKRRGAEVTLVVGRHTVPCPEGVEAVSVETTEDMYKAVLSRVEQNDVFIMAGAPCDYAPENYSQSKIKSKTLTVSFSKTADIAAAVGKVKGDKVLVAFAAETDSDEANAAHKLKSKNADFVVLNNIVKNDVFGSDTDVVKIVDSQGVTAYGKMSKDCVANVILDRVLKS